MKRVRLVVSAGRVRNLHAGASRVQREDVAAGRIYGDVLRPERLRYVGTVPAVKVKATG